MIFRANWVLCRYVEGRASQSTCSSAPYTGLTDTLLGVSARPPLLNIVVRVAQRFKSVSGFADSEMRPDPQWVEAVGKHVFCRLHRKAASQITPGSTTKVKEEVSARQKSRLSRFSTQSRSKTVWRKRPTPAKSSRSDHRSSAVIQCGSDRPARYSVQIRSTAGLDLQINESPYHLLLGGLLDLLGLRDGVFPGVVLLSRRR